MQCADIPRFHCHPLLFGHSWLLSQSEKDALGLKFIL